MIPGVLIAVGLVALLLWLFYPRDVAAAPEEPEKKEPMDPSVRDSGRDTLGTDLAVPPGTTDPVIIDSPPPLPPSLSPPPGQYVEPWEWAIDLYIDHAPQILLKYQDFDKSTWPPEAVRINIIASWGTGMLRHHYEEYILLHGTWSGGDKSTYVRLQAAMYSQALYYDGDPERPRNLPKVPPAQFLAENLR